ncbi:MAG: MFS transporter [Deltaproteobacteria bacterium]|nr:MFS transporter [Deltaproteobacteria bacterium]MBW2306430.1 MFS transporter [Deltaproteobacteria bacterium]
MKSQRSLRWFILPMFMVAHAVNDGFGWIIPPLLPAVREHFHLSYTEMGAFFTAFRFFGNIFQAPAAYLVYFAPVSSILVCGLLWSSVWMFLASLSPSYGVLVWLSAISGLGRSTYHPLAVTMLSRVFGREGLGRAMALHLSGSSAGMVIGPFLAGLLLSRYSWRLPIQTWSALGVLAGLSLFFFLKHQKQELHVKGKTLRWPFLSRPLGIYLVAVSTWGLAQGGLMAFLPLFLVDYRNFSTGKAAAAFGIMAFSGAICRPFLGALMDRMGRRKPVVIGGFILAGLSILAVITFETPWILYLSIILLGIFGSGHSGLADTFMIEMIPSHRREETLGFIYTVRMGIASLSPLFMGFASERISLYNSFLILVPVAGFAALLLLLAEERPME